MAKTVVDWIALVLVTVGALNWGLVGLFDYNLVSTLFGTETLATIVYSLVGVSGVYMLYFLTKH